MCFLLAVVGAGGGQKKRKGADGSDEPTGRIDAVIGEVNAKPTDSTAVRDAINMDMNFNTMLNGMALLDLEAMSDTAKFYAKTGHNDTCLRALASHLPVLKGLQANFPIPQ